jgi:1-acyl-sn-glycerol-3-phosphate acyltransferase
MRKREDGIALAFCVAVLRPPMMALTRRDWRGTENIPPAGTGCVVVANHISYFDPLAIAHFLYDNGRVPRFLVKSELFGVFFVGRVLTGAGQIPVFRNTAEAAKALSAAVAAVNRGECVVVYTEGTITRDPQIWPMVAKTGAARIALTTGCPLLPVAQWGAHEVLAPYGRRVRLLPRKTMQVRAGRPVDLDDLRAQRVTPQLLRLASERASRAVTTLLEDIRGEQAPEERLNLEAHQR